jgi:hypothetical protein
MMTLAVVLLVAVAGADKVRMLCPVVMVSIAGKVRFRLAGVERTTLLPVVLAFWDNVMV